MKALVNGASGYIGYHLTKKLLDAGHTVYAVYRRSLGHIKEFKDNKNLITIRSGQENLKEKIEGLNIDVWYQLLWDGAVGEQRTDALLQEKNVVMYIKALQTAEEMGCKKIVYTGTIYEKLADTILNNEKANRHSFYVLAKAQAHQLTSQLAKGMNIRYIWVNFCHPVGKYMNPKQLFPSAVNAFKNDLPMTFGKCEDPYDIVSVGYLAEVLTKLGEKDVPKKSYFVGSGKPEPLKDYITKTAKAVGLKKEVEFGTRPDDGLVFKKEWFDTSDLEKDTGCKYTEEFEELVKKYAEI